VDLNGDGCHELVRGRASRWIGEPVPLGVIELQATTTLYIVVLHNCIPYVVGYLLEKCFPRQTARDL
jgi:hypothetical protein